MKSFKEFALGKKDDELTEEIIENSVLGESEDLEEQKKWIYTQKKWIKREKKWLRLEIANLKHEKLNMECQKCIDREIKKKLKQ